MLEIALHALALALLLIFLMSIGGRLLGIHQSWIHSVVASGSGLLIGSLLAAAIAPGSPLPYPVFFLSAILLPALLASMAISVLLELLARPAPLIRVQGNLAGIPRPLSALRRFIARERRYSRITWIVTQRGLVPFLFGRGPSSTDAPPLTPSLRMIRNLRDGLAEAGGIFIKLGQVLSTRSDLFPPEVLAELAMLQDAAPPVPRAEMEEWLTAELGASPHDLFAEFIWKPVASASIAQVYRARLASGASVAVKVQRPGIESLIEGDLDILLRIARLAESGTAWGKEFHAVDLAHGFAESLNEELDFRIEARNITAVASALKTSDRVCIPKVHPDLSTRRVLVIDWLDGKNVRDAEDLLEELHLDREVLARDLLAALFGEVMREGTFHADPHPGNVMVLRDGRLGLLDFGSVGRIDPFQQAALRSALGAIHRRDEVELRIALLGLAAEVSRDTDNEALERALARFMAQYLSTGIEISPAMLSELTGLLLRFGMAFPPEIAAVFRAMVTLEGTLNILCPGFSMIDEARALAMRWAKEELAPSAISRRAANEFQSLLPLLARLPRRFDRITESVERGSFSINVRLFADSRDERLISTMVGRAILAFLGATLGLMSVILLPASGGPQLIAPIGLFQALGYVGLCVSLMLILRVVVALVRDRVV